MIRDTYCMDLPTRVFHPSGPLLRLFSLNVKRKPKHRYCVPMLVYAIDAAHAEEIFKYEYPKGEIWHGQIYCVDDAY